MRVAIPHSILRTSKRFPNPTVVAVFQSSPSNPLSCRRSTLIRMSVEDSSTNRSKTRATISDYGAVSKDYASGNLNHDVSQNINALLTAIGKEAPLDILDLGCAGGRDLLTFKQLGHKPVGVDGAPEFCEIARTYSKCEVIESDFLDLADHLEARSFDGVFANASLFHIPSASLPAVLQTIVRALKPDGVLFVSNAHGFGEDKEGWTNGRTTNTRSWVCWLSEETWCKYCEEAG